MNKNLFLQLLVVLPFTSIQNQIASNTTTPKPAPVRPLFGNSSATPTPPAPTPTTPAIPPAVTNQTPVISTSPLTPAPSASENSKPGKKTLEQARKYILKQIKDGKAPAGKDEKDPAGIKTDGISESDLSKLLLPIQNDTSSSVYIGFENNMGTLSEIPGSSSSPKNRILIPAECNYLIYNSNNPTGKAISLSYQSNGNNAATKPNAFQSCEVKNGSSYNKKSIQAFTGIAYISIDPSNQNNLIIVGKPN